MLKSDSELERDVKEELRWNPDLDATDIAVSARSGAVTLTGFVRSYKDKYEAEGAAKRVAGVIAVANDLKVRIPSVYERPDPDIARDAATAIKSYLPISYEQIKAVVKDGWVTLEGEVEWQYEQQAAETAVRRLEGVKGVSNLIEIKPRGEPYDIKRKIQEAILRNAEVDANQIIIETNGSVVILKGTVRSWVEREEAERVAWRAPGVTKVEDHIVVRNEASEDRAVDQRTFVEQRTFNVVASMIFVLVALLHLLRIYMGWPIVIGSWTAPMWVSWFGLVVAGGLSYFGLSLARRS